MDPRDEGHRAVELDRDGARQGATGFHLRYILATGIGGILLAFLLLAIIG